MTTITETDVRHVARLSRLKLTDEEVSLYTAQLARVLEYVAKLEELDLAGVEPMAHPTDIANKLREDVPTDPMSLDAALANAPAADPPFFKVPKVLGEGSS